MSDKIDSGIAVILLAAGESTRLGRPKQLLTYKGQTLVANCLNIADHSDADLIIVVLGAHAEIIKKEIAGNSVHIIKNANWEEGMASSIRAGINELMKISPLAKGAILMVCDQPYVTSGLLNNLMTTGRESGKRIVACSYADTFGPPVLFHKNLFPDLLKLTGDVGARSVIQQHADAVEVIPFPEGSHDVDTDADYERIRREGN